MGTKENRGGRAPVSRSSYSPRQPEKLGEILSRLFAARGWGRRQERARLEEAWLAVVGTSGADHTRVGLLRRGVLEIVVDSAVLLQELAHFRKRGLLEQLRSRLPGVTINDLRFRAGATNSEGPETVQRSRHGKPAPLGKDNSHE
jgi:predicted nucleic acid-binding Zn ribbon protein